MNGPVVVLLLVLAVVPIFILLLRLDAYLTERDYQRRQRGDESQRYQAALDSIARAQATQPAYKHRRPRKDTPND